MSRFWTEERIKLLLSCETEEELQLAFPNHKLSTLQRYQRQYGNGDARHPKADGKVESAKDRQISRLRDEVKHLRRLYKTQTKEAAGTEALVNAIFEVVPTLESVRVPKAAKVSGSIEEEELILLLSDLHFGEVVDEAETGGISVFNMDIAKRRFDYTIDKAIAIAKEKQKGFHYRKISVFLLGDLVSGIIHDELKQHDEVGIVKQIMFATDVIVAGILKLCQVFESVHVASVVGNHGRVSEKYYFKGKANNNFDYLVAKTAEKMTANQSNLTWSVPESFWSMETVCNDTFFLTHGDFIRSWAGIPWYGLSRAYLKWRTLAADYGISFDHMAIGHFHNPNIFTMVRGMMFVNGSLKGGGPKGDGR